MEHSSPNPNGLSPQVHSRARVALEQLYDRIQTETDHRRPRCEVSGRCCRFEEYGHRLYVTALELAVFTAKLAEREYSVQDNPGRCPFQAGGLCSVHSIRPMGCRLFFCDSSSRQWQEEQYEKFHGEVKALHDELDVPYSYMEWIAGLRQSKIIGPENAKAG